MDRRGRIASGCARAGAGYGRRHARRDNVLRLAGASINKLATLSFCPSAAPLIVKMIWHSPLAGIAPPVTRMLAVPTTAVTVSPAPRWRECQPTENTEKRGLGKHPSLRRTHGRRSSECLSKNAPSGSMSEAIASGSATAAAIGGGRVGRPRQSRIARIASGEWSDESRGRQDHPSIGRHSFASGVDPRTGQ